MSAADRIEDAERTEAEVRRALAARFRRIATDYDHEVAFAKARGDRREMDYYRGKRDALRYEALALEMR